MGAPDPRPGQGSVGGARPQALRGRGVRPRQSSGDEPSGQWPVLGLAGLVGEQRGRGLPLDQGHKGMSEQVPSRTLPGCQMLVTWLSS